MKVKILLILFVISLAGCKSTKIERSSEKGLKGGWTLNSISTDQGNVVNIKNLFNQAPPNCFKGSEWNFVSNNNSGTYHFQDAACDNAVHSIKWFMEENGDEVHFLWKFIPEGMKAKDVKNGYRLKLLSESDTMLELEQEAAFEGGIIKIYYHFIRN